MESEESQSKQLPELQRNNLLTALSFLCTCIDLDFALTGAIPPPTRNPSATPHIIRNNA